MPTPLRSLLAATVLTTGALLPVVHADTLHSRDYRCASLIERVKDEGKLTFKVRFGQLTVHASRDACDSFTHDAVRSTWRAQDTRQCVLGYTCDKRIIHFDE
ncbi:MAG: hypothetical protein AAGA11_11120 [Pseudomonadota bacterium]